MISRIRRWTARVLLELMLKPAGWHAYLDRQLKKATDINYHVWRWMGARMASLYEWLNVPETDNDD